MDVVCIGAGPAGLYTALLLKKSDPSHDITVIDRNPPDATYGWGVVFSEETLAFLQEADAETYAEITSHFIRWENIDIHYRGERIRSGGHAFAGLSRARLLGILQKRCRDLGVTVRFQTEATGDSDFAGCDLIVASDGFNSRTRQTHDDVFKPSFDTHATKYIWLGMNRSLDAFTFIFRKTEYGMFQVHAYPFDRTMSTFIVECTEDTWRRAGLDSADEQASIAFCEQLFAPELDGARLMSNRSAWINFVTLKNESWHHQNIVLIGDAAHTAHFSVGSGTKMAMEDAIALAGALERHPRELGQALVEFEELRQPSVERTQEAARDSSLWFENVRRYARFEPMQFAFSLLTRSKRITYDNLKLRDAKFSHQVDRWFSLQADHLNITPNRTHSVRPPLANAFRMRDVTVPNRVVLSPVWSDTAEAGIPAEADVVHLTSAARREVGLLMTDMVAVSPDGRISPGTPGLYCADHVGAWRRTTDRVHDQSSAMIAVQLGHAGRRGATRPRREGIDRPLRRDAWPIISASAIRYTPWSQTPRAMNRDDMDRIREAFVSSVHVATESNFDVVVLQFGHGYLLGSFLSPLTNRRTDEYGGSMTNRMRYPLEVFDAVRAEWPQARPIAVSLCATNWAKGGIQMEDVLAIALTLKDRGCDAIDVVTGQTVAHANPTYGRAWQTRFSDQIRNDVEIPTMTGGNITTTDEINTILASGRADLCIVAPSELAVPPLPIRPLVKKV